MDYLRLKTSPPRRSFKENLGQANHFLVTIEVGLEAVRAGSVDPAGPTWTSWNPQDQRRSADRSSGFATRAALSFLVTALDAYVLDLLAMPCVIQDDEAKNRLLKQEDSTARIKALAQICNLTDTIPWGMANVARPWRHRLLHRNATNTVTARIRRTLLDAATEIEREYSGLDVELLLAHLDQGKEPRFKETTALIRGCQQLVQAIDSFWLDKLDLEDFASDTVDAYLTAENGAHLKQRIDNIWSKDKATTLRTLKNVLGNAGFTLDEGRTECSVAAEELLEGLVNEPPSKVKARLG